MPTILVADDEPDFEMLVRQRFRRRIRSGELNFLFAANGEHALQTLVENPAIDVLLTDINMPRMNGHDFLQALRSREAISDHLVFMFTTSAR